MRALGASVVLIGALASPFLAAGQESKQISAADVAEVKAVNESFARLMVAKDWGGVVGVVSLYTDDAVLCPPNEPAVRGTADIRAFLKGFLRLARS